jgi:hypothetical protein
LSATVFDRADFGLLGWQDPTPRTALTTARSRSFRLVGEPDLRPLYSRIRAFAIGHVKDSTIGGPFWMDRTLDRLVRVREPGHLTPEGYCAVFEVEPPFTGEVGGCVPADYVDELGVRVPQDVPITGKETDVPGVLG